jgi:hypothetical protein
MSAANQETNDGQSRQGQIVETTPTKLKLPLAYYDTAKKDYWILDELEEWIAVSEASLKRQLRGRGYAARIEKDETISKVDQAINTIQLRFGVSYAGPLAGHQKGLAHVCGHRILVKDSPKLVEPLPGNYAVLFAFLQNLFGTVQLPYFLGWLKIAYESLREGHNRPGQLLVLAGERNSGKSLLQKLITEALGGRAAKPYRYMSGATEFNGELFGAEHLIIEDEVASTSISARRNFGAKIKDFTVNEVQSCHAKNRQALSLTPFWRVSLSVNEEPENLMVLPPLDDSLEDKVMLLRVAKVALPMPTSTKRERDEFWETLLRGLPGLLAHITQWEIPQEIRSERFGICHFHNPELLKALDELTPEAKLLALIDACFRDGPLDAAGFYGTSEKLRSHLCAHPLHEHDARKLLDWHTATGTYLARLANKHPDRVTYERTETERRWRITPPQGLPPRPLANIDFSTCSVPQGANPFAKEQSWTKG